MTPDVAETFARLEAAIGLQRRYGAQATQDMYAVVEADLSEALSRNTRLEDRLRRARRRARRAERKAMRAAARVAQLDERLRLTRRRLKRAKLELESVRNHRLVRLVSALETTKTRSARVRGGPDNRSD